MTEKNKILSKMLERLYTSLASGPVLNCRPHSSRQRIDLTQLGRLDGSSPESIAARLLGPQREVKLVGGAEPPRERLVTEATDDERARRDAWQAQQSLLSKLRTIAEDAKTYEQDTGAQILYLGLPVLSIPPDTRGAGRFGSSKRVLAPIAFVPVSISIKMTRPQAGWRSVRRRPVRCPAWRSARTRYLTHARRPPAPRVLLPSTEGLALPRWARQSRRRVSVRG